MADATLEGPDTRTGSECKQIGNFIKIYKYQSDIYPQDINAFQKSFSHIFYLCFLSPKLLKVITWVTVFPGNACANINSSLFSDWTHCSNLLEGSTFLKLFMLLTHQLYLLIDCSESLLLPQAFSGFSKWGLLSGCGARASHVGEHGL